MILPRMIEAMFPRSYAFIYHVGWNAGKDAGQALVYKGAEERLDRWELKDLKNLEFNLGYNHARRIALGQLTLADFETQSDREPDSTERSEDGGVDRTTQS